MITRVFAKNFKGLTFETELASKNLFVGDNGTGKSARSLALTLARMGYVPGTGKRPSDIMDDFGSADKLVVGFDWGGHTFERFFSKASTGSVSQRLRIDQKKAGKEDFAIAVHGCPAIFDLSAFLDLSDQKKINQIFDLFPPGGDMDTIDRKIDSLTEKRNILESDIRNTEGVIAQLTQSRSSLELPAGTLPEIQAEIENLIKQVKTAENDLKRIEIKKAEDKAKAAAEKAAAEKAEIEKRAAEKAREEKEARERAEAEQKKAQTPFEPPPANNSTTTATQKNYPAEPIPAPKTTEISATKSIEKILAALDEAGCDACAARLVAKMEFKKHASKGFV